VLAMNWSASDMHTPGGLSLSRMRRPATLPSSESRLKRLAKVLQGFHLVAFSMLMRKQALPVLSVL
jgi:hypothetical protein